MDLQYEIKIVGPVANGTARKIAHEQVIAFLHDATQHLKTMVKENTPEGVGARYLGGGLRGTIHGEVESGTEISRGIVGHTSTYGDPAERGRRPGKMPPSSVLVRWVELKFNASGADARRIAFFIRRKIMRQGTKGAAMFFTALDEGWPVIIEMAQRYGIRIADRMRG